MKIKKIFIKNYLKANGYSEAIVFLKYGSHMLNVEEFLVLRQRRVGGMAPSAQDYFGNV